MGPRKTCKSSIMPRITPKCDFCMRETFKNEKFSSGVIRISPLNSLVTDSYLSSFITYLLLYYYPSFNYRGYFSEKWPQNRIGECVNQTHAGVKKPLRE